MQENLFRPIFITKLNINKTPKSTYFFTYFQSLRWPNTR